MNSYNQYSMTVLTSFISIFIKVVGDIGEAYARIAPASNEGLNQS